MDIMDALIAMDTLIAKDTLIANMDACLLNICFCQLPIKFKEQISPMPINFTSTSPMCSFLLHVFNFIIVDGWSKV